MRKTEIRVERVDSFFERGRKIAKAADRGEPIPSSRVVAFEDVEALLHVLTEKRVLLIKQIKETPTSISMLARIAGNSSGSRIASRSHSGRFTKNAGTSAMATTTRLNADIQHSVFPHGALKVFGFMARFIYAENSGLSRMFTLAPAHPFH